MTAFIAPTNQSRVPKSVVNVIVRMKELYLEPRWVVLKLSRPTGGEYGNHFADNPILGYRSKRA